MSNHNGSSGITGKLLMVVGLAAIAGLLWWLSRVAVPSTAAVDVADTSTDTTAAAESMAPVVDVSDLVGNEARYAGKEINLGDVTVTQIMSPEILWIDLPGGAPFLVKLTPSAMAERPELQARVRVIGRVLEKTDSILNAWEQSGAIMDAGQRAQSEYGKWYFEAKGIRLVSGM